MRKLKSASFYDDAHVFVAAIRVYSFLNNKLPNVENICDMLSITTDKGHYIAGRLRDLKIIEIVEGAFGVRLHIKNYLSIEDIPKSSEEPKLADEIKKFQNSEKEILQKVEAFKNEQKQKEKELFAEIDRKLKNKKRKTDI